MSGNVNKEFDFITDMAWRYVDSCEDFNLEFELGICIDVVKELVDNGLD